MQKDEAEEYACIHERYGLEMKGDEISVVWEKGVFTVTEDNQGECRSCQAPILWTITKKGKKMPVDMPTEGPTTSHFATCPARQEA